MKIITRIMAGALLLVTGALAETIPLQNGGVIEGQILRTNAASITVRTSSGVQTYARSELLGQREEPAAETGAVEVPAAETRPALTTGSPDQDWQDRASRFLVHGLLTFRAGQIVWFLGSVLLLIQGFRTSVAWGFLVLFTNLVGAILFLVFHPKQAIVPLLIMLVGIVIFAMAPFWALWGAGMR